MTFKKKDIERYRRCFEKSPFGFEVIKVERSTSGEYTGYQYLYINAVAEKLTAHLFDENLGKYISASLSWQIEKRVEFLGKAAFGETQLIDYFHNEKTGRYFQINAYKIEDGICACLITDITEQREINKELEDSKRETETFINSIPGGVATFAVTKDGEFELKFCSKGIESLVGVEKKDDFEDLMEKPYQGIYHEDYDDYMYTVANAVKEKKDFEKTVRVYHNDGRIVWLNAHGCIVGEEDGKTIIQIIYHNISEETQLYHDILQKTNEMVIAGDVETRKIFFVNRAVTDTIGKTFADCIGKTCHDLLRHCPQICENCSLSGLLENETGTHTVELFGRHYEAIVQRINWNGHDVFIDTLTDRSDFWKLQKMLREENNRLSATVNNIPSGIAVYNISEDGEISVVSANPIVNEIFGIEIGKVSELSGEKILANVYKDDREVVKTTLKNINEATDKTSVTFRLYNIGKQQYIWVHLNLTVAGMNENKYLVYTTVTDITELKLLEENLIIEKQKSDIAIENSDMLVWTYHINNGDFVYIKNQSSYFSWGSDVIHNACEVLIGNVIHPDSAENFKNLHERVKNGEKLVSSDIKIYNEKNEHWVNITYYTLFNGKTPFGAIGFTKDITETINAKADRSQMELALLSSSLLFWDLDLTDGRILSSNQLAKDFGFDNSKYPFYMDLLKNGKIMADTSDEYVKIYDDLCHNKEVKERLLHFNKQKGDIEWIEVSYTIICDSSNKPIRATAIGENVTESIFEKRQFEEELRYQEAVQSENLLAKTRANITKNIIESYVADDLICAHVEGYTYDKAVEAFANTASNPKQKDEVINTLSLKNLLENYNNGRASVSVDYRRKTRDGKMIWVSFKVKMYSDPDSGDVKAFLYTYNIDSERVMTSIVDKICDSSYEVMCIIDTSMCKVTHYKNNSDVKKLRSVSFDYNSTMQHFIDIQIVKDDRAAAHKALGFANIIEQLSYTDKYNCTFAVTENKTVRRKSWTFGYMNENRASILMTRRDVSEIFEQQERQRQTLSEALLEAKKASVAKSEFLSRMSHEIRTPMNAIIGLASLMRDEIKGEAKAEDYLDKISSSSKFLLALLNDILDMSRIEQGRMELRPDKYSYKEFMNFTETLLQSVCTQYEVDFDYSELSIKNGLIVDKVRFNQMIMNLVSNAAKFTPKGGKVKISSSAKSIDGEKKKIMCSIFVEDNGIGISPEFLEKIFEPFVQENTEASPKAKGTGLGLPISRSIARRMGGDLIITSEKNKGTIATIVVPVEIYYDNEAKSKSYTEENNFSKLENKRILLAEDNEINSLIFKSLFEKINVRVDIAENGLIAVDKFSSSKIGYYDAIIMDVLMPVMNGLDAAREIRKTKREDNKIPIIAASANAFTEDINKSISAGMNAHLAKPIQPDEMFKTLLDLL